jgi:hypothetical protein
MFYEVQPEICQLGVRLQADLSQFAAYEIFHQNL